MEGLILPPIAKGTSKKPTQIRVNESLIIKKFNSNYESIYLGQFWKVFRNINLLTQFPCENFGSKLPFNPFHVTGFLLYLLKTKYFHGV